MVFLLRVNAFFNTFRKIRGKDNRISLGYILVRNLHVDIRGSHNTIIIKDHSVLRDCFIHIRGDNNRIVISDSCQCNQLTCSVEDNGNTIQVGEETHFAGSIELAALEGTTIAIGKNCMCSGLIHFRTSDSHSILNLKGERINQAKSIHIGNHVWIGRAVTCLKGSKISDDSIVGASSLVCGQFEETNVVIAGIPAEIVKTGVTWSDKRL